VFIARMYSDVISMFDVAVSLLLDKMMLETSSYRSKLLLIYVTVAKKVKFAFSLYHCCSCDQFVVEATEGNE
jgi:hypothetical protein